MELTYDHAVRVLAEDSAMTYLDHLSNGWTHGRGADLKSAAHCLGMLFDVEDSVAYNDLKSTEQKWIQKATNS